MPKIALNLNATAVYGIRWYSKYYPDLVTTYIYMQENIRDIEVKKLFEPEDLRSPGDVVETFELVLSNVQEYP